MATSKSARYLQDKARATTTGPTDSAREMADDVRGKATEAGEMVRRAAQHVTEHGDRLARDIAEFVSRRPLTSLLIAVGVGFFIGAAKLGPRLIKRR